VHTKGLLVCRYLGDERFQLALSVGLGMNIMGGDQFRQQQQSNGAAPASAPEPKSSPAQPEKPKEVLITPPLLGHCHHSCMQGWLACVQDMLTLMEAML
jgi:hypothetical protein